VLAPQATLQVNVPALAGEPTRAVVTLTGGDGQRFLFPGWASVEDDEVMAYGRVTFQFLPAGTWRVVRISVTPGSVVCVRVAFAGLSCAALPRDRYQRRRLPPHRRLAGCRLRMTTRALPGVS